MPSFEYHFNSLLITYWNLFWDSLLYCIAFYGNQFFEFYRNSTDWLPHDAESGCGESRNRLITVLYLFFLLFTWLLLLYSSFAGIFWVRILQTFWMIFINFNRSLILHTEKFFNSTSLYIYCFIVLLIVLLCFWSYVGRYSFYTFCLMHNLKKVFEQTEI